MHLTDRRRGAFFAFLCLALLGVMPIIAVSRPSGSDGLVFALGLTLWQLIFAMPLTLIEARRGAVPGLRLSPGLAGISLLTGALFGLSTFLYVAVADGAGPVTMAITLQAYPFIAMGLEALFEGRRRSLVELGLALLMALALVGLITGGSFRREAMSPWAVAGLSVPLIWAVAHMMLRRVLQRLPVTPNQVTVSRLAISGAVLLFGTLLAGRGQALFAALTEPAFHRIAALMGLAYYLELIFWFHAMRHIEVSLGSTITVPAPALTMLIGVALLGLPVATYQIVALAVVCAALFALLRINVART